MQAELQERTHPDGEIQVAQVDDSVMEVEVTEASTVTKMAVSEVSGIIDV